MRKTTTTAAAMLAVSMLAISACAQAPGTKPAASSAPNDSTSEFKACMVSDSGGFDDKSFNETSYKGLLKAGKELGIKTQDIQSKNNSDYAVNIQAMISAKCNIIVTVGVLLADATKAAAEQNPNIKFAIVDAGSEGKLPNHKGIIFNTAESSFLAGYLAAGMTKTGKVGTFGAMKVPSVTIFMDGFAQGVAQYNQAKKKNVQLIGWNPKAQDGQFIPGGSPFENQSGGKEAATSLISLGADIILPVAGPAGLGALQAVAATKGKVNAIWVDTDGYYSTSFKDQLITSVYKAMDIAVFNTIKEAKEGKFSNKPYIGTLKNDGTGLSPFHNFESKVPAELKAELEKLKSDIEAGLIKITSISQPKASQ